MSEMNWEKLLCRDRYMDSTVNEKNPDPRSQFLRDTDRVIFSSAFRRMQDKTQVFPIPKSDFVHNRLTHSLEVATVGRSLGLLCGEFVLGNNSNLLYHPKNNPNGFTSRDFGNVIYSACLAHDIGNPPFGHSGEKAIANFFINGTGKIYESIIDNPNKWADFKLFEGNALGFRILTNGHASGSEGGLRLTYATLGAFTKYPWEALASWEKEQGSLEHAHVVKGKFGFFQKEADIFSEIASKLGLLDLSKKGLKIWSRHPMAYLLEAADTICYRVIDIEDTHKLKLISTKEAIDVLSPLWRISKEGNYNQERIDEISDEGEKIGFLRAKAINALIYEVFDVFKLRYPEIMRGEYNGELIKEIENYTMVSDLKKLTSDRGFKNPNVLKIELAGFDVLGGLIEIFTSAYFNQSELKSEKLKELLPWQFKSSDGCWIDDPYEQILLICDNAARMTDKYALELYKNLKGISLPDLN